jgi:hypothetical protein
LNDAATQWTSGPLGQGTLQNSQCVVALGSASGTSVATSGNTLTWNLALTFAPGFSGTSNVDMMATTWAGATTGLQTRGTWTVPGGTGVTANGVVPNAGTGAAQTFALQYADTAGAADLAATLVWFDGSSMTTVANSCVVYYDAAAHTVSLLNDAAAQWTSGVMGQGTPLQNSQCTVALGSSTTVAASGNTLTWNLALTFAPGFSGTKNVDMYAVGGGGATSGLQTRGTWTVP